MMAPDDRDLLIRIAAHDEDALRELHTRYLPLLRSYLWYRHDLGLEQIEDVLQETFLSVWRSAQYVRNNEKVSAWLFQIAHRYALRFYRSEQRRPEGHTLAIQQADEPWQDSLEQSVLARISLDAAFDTLSSKHREILFFVFIQGFSVDEVAHILEIPPGTVKSRLSYARRALQQSLHYDQPAKDSRHV